MPPPRLIEIIPNALVRYGITLDQLSVYSAPASDDPDLRYCVTWGAARHAAGTLRWWADIQRLANEPTRLYDRNEDWRELVATVGSVNGAFFVADRWVFNANGRHLGRIAISLDRRRLRAESDASLRTRLINEFGGETLYDEDDDPRAGLVAETSTPIVEPKGRYDILLEDDDL